MTDNNILPLAEGDFMISLTSNARDYLAKYIASKGSKGVRFSVKKAGCSGLMYVSELSDSPVGDDWVFSVKNNNKDYFEFLIFVDKKANKALNGVVVDYVKQSLGQAKLTYINPNESAKCGCGESFMMDENQDDSQVDDLDNKDKKS
jgi:iron-sulfur cluster assembly protein